MSILHPTFFTDNVTNINPDILSALDIRGMILDIDDTLTYHGSPTISPGVKLWLDNIKKFTKLIIVSNNSKQRVSSFSKQIGIPYISPGLKPLTYGIKKAIKYLELPPQKIVLVGDQIFTDILGANIAHIRSILVEPKDGNDILMFKIKRFLETNIRKKIRRNKKLNLLNFKNKTPQGGILWVKKIF